MRIFTKTLAAAALAVTVAASPAQATTQQSDPNAGLIFTALFVGLVGLLAATGGGGTTTTSTKDGPALDLDLPDPGVQTITNF